MKISLFTLTLILVSGFVAAQDPQVYDFSCGSIMQEAIGKRSAADAEYIKGDKMYLCIHIMPYGIRIPFRLVVDEYNTIEIKNCKTTPFHHP